MFLALTMVTVVACQSEEDLDAVGYLNFDVDTFVSVRPGSKAIVDGYQPKRLTVQIVNAQKQVVYHTDDYDNWQEKGKDLPLKAGEYILVAHSYGFDGKESGFDIPYYLGKKNVTIKAGQRNVVELTCTQANVKVTVNFDKTFVESFKSAKAQISSGMEGISPLVFDMGSVTTAAYFPAGKLSSKISVKNKHDREFSQDDVFATDAKPRDHYILNYKLSDSGSSNIEVQTDDALRIYTFTFSVATKPSTQLGMTLASGWSNFAFLEGEILSQKADDVLDSQLIKFEYKLKNADTWTVADASLQDKTYKAKVTGLTPNTEYMARLVYKGKEELASEPMNFKTDLATVLPNGQLDDWFKSGKTWYATAESDFNAGRKFWDTSNVGTNLASKNNTEPEDVKVHTASGKSARIKSLDIMGNFAAGSLYSGEFGGLIGFKGAKLNLGRPFTGRPTQLTGWFQYATGGVTNVGKGTPAGAPQKGQSDLWSGYIALTTGSYVLDNTNLAGTARDYKKLLADPHDKFVVAYGELSAEECAPSSAWKQFTINLKYKDLVTKPTHVIIVFSSSKYGDYFTGSTSSLLYLDDLELVYGAEPQVVGQ